jgi:hypothetical protein
MENRLIDIAVFAFMLFFIVPLVISAVLYALSDRVKEWRTADRSSAGLLPPARADQEAVVRIFSARTVRWRGIIATHRRRAHQSTAVSIVRRGGSRSGLTASCRTGAGLGACRG